MINSIANSVTDNVIVDEIRALCYLSSKDGCDWTFYLQHPTPVSFQGLCCVSNQGQYIERFVRKNSRYMYA